MDAAARHGGRMARAAAGAGAEGLAAVVVAPSPDLAYLVAYDPPPLERPTLLVLRPGHDPVLLVPELERALALASGAGEVAELVGWRDGSDPFAAAIDLLPPEGTVGLSDRIWGAHVLRLEAAAPELRWVSGSGVLGRLRARKDSDELDALRRAGAAADATFDDIRALPFAGRTEREVSDDLRRLLVEHGHDTAEFAIVGSGSNGVSPHHEPSDRVIGPGDPVVLDFGGSLDGYCSDTSRTVIVGEPPDGFEDVFALVHEGQEAAVQVVRPGIAIQEVDRAARRVIDGGGFGDRFIHRTGHGIGLEVHEPPYAVEGDETLLEPGMTFSVEPGIYLEGRFGVRIEDIVAVTDDGVERLNRSDRRLIRVS
jgi:D-alanyl-D-alanine dipeptidase